MDLDDISPSENDSESEPEPEQEPQELYEEPEIKKKKKLAPVSRLPTKIKKKHVQEKQPEKEDNSDYYSESEEPVVVNPDTDSKKAFTNEGIAPEKRYGKQPIRLIKSHERNTVR